MRKAIIGIAAVCLAVGALFVCSCSLEQQCLVSRQLGLAAAVTWTGIDNPDADDVAVVLECVGVIKAIGCKDCGDGTYYSVIYPAVDKYIGEHVKERQQPIARLGASFILISLDTAFAMNPSWKDKSDNTNAIVAAFCEGVESGLTLSPADPVVQAARQAVPVRAARGTK